MPVRHSLRQRHFSVSALLLTTLSVLYLGTSPTCCAGVSFTESPPYSPELACAFTPDGLDKLRIDRRRVNVASLFPVRGTATRRGTVHVCSSAPSNETGISMHRGSSSKLLSEENISVRKLEDSSPAKYLINSVKREGSCYCIDMLLDFGALALSTAVSIDVRFDGLKCTMVYAAGRAETRILNRGSEISPTQYNIAPSSRSVSRNPFLTSNSIFLTTHTTCNAAFPCERDTPIVVSAVIRVAESTFRQGMLQLALDPSADASVRRTLLFYGSNNDVVRLQETGKINRVSHFRLPALRNVESSGSAVFGWSVELLYPPNRVITMPVARFPAFVLSRLVEGGDSSPSVQILPSHGPFNRSTTITLLGSDLPDLNNSDIQFGPVPVPKSYVIFATTSRIVFRSPLLPATADSATLSAGTYLNVTISNSRQVKPIVFAQYQLQEPLDVNLTLFMSSYDVSSEKYVIPVVCNKASVPVLVASVTSSSQPMYDVPRYEFSYRNNVGDKSTIYKMISGPEGSPSNAVVLTDPSLFSAIGRNSDFVEVRVFVTLGNASGESLLNISRKLRPDKIGVTILPPLPQLSAPVNNCEAIDLPPSRVLIVRGIISSALNCPSPQLLGQTREWTVNNEMVVAHSGRDDIASLKNVALVGLDSGVAIPSQDYIMRKATRVSFRVSTKLFNKRNNSVVADGIAFGNLQLPGAYRPVAKVNGGELRVIISRKTRYSLSGVDANDREGGGRDGQRFIWSCNYRKINSESTATCDSDSLPSGTAVRSFTVSFDAFQDQSDSSTFIVEYSLVIAANELSSRAATLEIVVVSSASGAKPFVSSSFLTTNAGRQVISTNPCRAYIEQYESLVLQPPADILPRGNTAKLQVNEFQYALFSTSSPNVNILRDDLLLNYSSYWSSKKRTNGLLGIRGNVLDAGEYILAGAINSSDIGEASIGSLWKFKIASRPKIHVVSVPVTEGFVRQTVFYAIASSIPIGADCLFYFALRKSSEATSVQNRITPNTCLGGCSGERAAAFSVENEGTYFVQVDMVSTTSMVLDSTLSTESITVQSNSEMVPEPVGARLTASISQKDETGFLDTLRLATTSLLREGNVSLVKDHVADAARGLRAIATNSFLTPLAASQFVGLGSRVLSASVDDSYLGELLEVNDACVRRITEANSGEYLVPALQEFYIVANQRTLRQNSTSAETIAMHMRSEWREFGPGMPIASRSISDMSPVLSNIRSLASEDILRAAMRGRECGYSQSLEVRSPSRRSIPEQSSSKDGKDTLRATSICYAGQPMPYYKQCDDRVASKSAMDADLGENNVIGIVESDSALSSSKATVFSSKIRFLSYLEGSIHMPNLRISRSDTDYVSCINVTFELQSKGVTKEAISLKAVKTQFLRCPDAIRLYQTNVVSNRRAHTRSNPSKITAIPTKSSRLELFRSGMIRVNASVTRGNEVFAAVDESSLLRCIVDVEGENVSQAIAIIASVLLVLAILTFCSLLACYFSWLKRENVLANVEPTTADGEIAEVASSDGIIIAKMPDMPSTKSTAEGLGDDRYSLVRLPEQHIFLDEESDIDDTSSSKELALEPLERGIRSGGGVRVESGSLRTRERRAIDDDPPIVFPGIPQ